MEGGGRMKYALSGRLKALNENKLSLGDMGGLRVLEGRNTNNEPWLINQSRYLSIIYQN